MSPDIGELARLVIVTVVDDPPEDAIVRDSSAKDISAILLPSQSGSTV